MLDANGARSCRTCGTSKVFSEFSKSQWMRPNGEGRCTSCIVGADAADRAARAQQRAGKSNTSAAAVEALTSQMAHVEVSGSPSAEKRTAPEAATTPRVQTSAPAQVVGEAAVGTATVTPRLCVGNLSKGKASSGRTPAGFNDIRVDRQTALGNPFPMGADGHDETFRDAVCEACEELLTAPTSANVDTIASRHGLRVDGRFRKKGQADPQAALGAALDELEARVRSGESLRLLCWCHPKRCHGDAIAAILQRRIGTDGVTVVPHPTVASPAATGSMGREVGSGGDHGGSPAPTSARRGSAGGRGGRGRGRGRVGILQGRG